MSDDAGYWGTLLEGLWGQNEGSYNDQTRRLLQEDKYSLGYGAQEKINAGLHQDKSKISLINEEERGQSLVVGSSCYVKGRRK